MSAHRLLRSFFLGVPYGILTISHKKELLRSLWVVKLLTCDNILGFGGLGLRVYGYHEIMVKCM